MFDKGGLFLKRPLICALVCVLLLGGCTQPVQPTPTPTPQPSDVAAEPAESTIFAMDTVMSLRVYGGEADLDAVIQRINGIEADLSVTRETSQVWAVNHAGGEPVTVGEDFVALAELAHELGERTGGALDITMYPVVRAWGFTTSEYQIPSDETISSLLEKVDYTALTVDGDDAALPEGMEMDLGAVAKGYAGEMAADLLRERGVASALLNMGGNVQTVGAKPDGSAWRIGIQDPNQPTGAYLGVLLLKDQAAVTSGGYERYFERDGVRYWHIMDPHTGAPARSGLTSVTIVGDKGGLCDGLSTSLFVLGLDGALDYWRTYGGFEAIVVDEDQGVWLTGGLKDSFTLQDGLGYSLHIVEE